MFVIINTKVVFLFYTLILKLSCLFLKSATIIQYTIKGRFMSR